MGRGCKDIIEETDENARTVPEEGRGIERQYQRKGKGK
jgi:hypothetical protein